MLRELKVLRDFDKSQFEGEVLLGMSDDEILTLASLVGDKPIFFPGESILSVLAQKTDRVELCEKLMAAGLSPDQSLGGNDSMQDCIEFNEVAKCRMLEALLKYSRYPIRDQHSSGGTLLHCAVSRRKMDAAKFLIRLGASMYDMDIDCDRVVDYDMPTEMRDELLRFEEECLRKR